MATTWCHPYFAYHPAESDIRNRGVYTGMGLSAKAQIIKIEVKEQKEVEMGNCIIAHTI